MKTTKIKFERNVSYLNKVTSKYYNEKKLLDIVRKEGINIQYIKKPSEEVKFEAIKEDVNSLIYIDNPTKEIIDMVRDCNCNDCEIQLIVKLWDEENNKKVKRNN